MAFQTLSIGALRFSIFCDFLSVQLLVWAIADQRIDVLLRAMIDVIFLSMQNIISRRAPRGKKLRGGLPQ